MKATIYLLNGKPVASVKKAWKDIPGFGGCYQASNYGRIKSLEREGTCGGILRHVITSRGYHRVVLSMNGVRHNFSVHRLVGITFIPNSENKPEINHKDGNKANNNKSNLEWTTKKENIAHGVEHGLYEKGSSNHRAKLNEYQIRVIRKCDLSMGALAKIFGVSKSTICRAINKITWKHA